MTNHLTNASQYQATGKYSQSMVSELLAEIDDDTPTGRDTLEVIKNVAGVTFLGMSRFPHPGSIVPNVSIASRLRYGCVSIGFSLTELVSHIPIDRIHT